MIEIWVFYVNTNTLHILHGYPSVKHIFIMNLKVLRVPVYFISFGTKPIFLELYRALIQ